MTPLLNNATLGYVADLPGHLKLGHVLAVPKSPGHLVVGGHLRLGLAEPSLRDSLVEQRFGDPYLKLGYVAVPNECDQLVVDHDCGFVLPEVPMRNCFSPQR